MHIELHKGEKILKKGHANYYENHLLNTGRLYLTNERIYFSSHPLNFKKVGITMPLQEVTGVELRNNYKVFSHGFYIVMHNGTKHHFAVWQRRRWKKIINEVIAAQA